jgi:hypothetical protein
MSFDREDYEHTAKLLRSGNQKVVDAALSNNFNIILAALDTCAKLIPDPPGKALIVQRENDQKAFDEFWSVYPKRDGANPKKPALQKFIGLIVRHKVSPQLLIDRARELAAQHCGKNPKFIPMAVTWLNQERWKDVDPPKNGSSHRGGSMLDVVEELENRDRGHGL